VSPRQRTGPTAGRRAVATGTAALVPDAVGDGWTVVVNGVPSSHVDPSDPLRLDFEYVRWVADLLDVLAPEGESLRTVHLGGAGCTLARYVAATRPGSRQVVLELDPGVLALARDAFGLRSTAMLRLKVADARAGLAELRAGSYEVVIRDAFEGETVPVQFLDAVDRVLADGGCYLANLADAPPMSLARQEAATALARFEHVVLIAEPAQFTGRRYGNVVLAASHAPLPLAALGRRLASGPVRARLLEAGEVVAFAGGRRASTDPARLTPEG
jgi:spermidine synthase